MFCVCLYQSIHIDLHGTSCECFKINHCWGIWTFPRRCFHLVLFCFAFSYILRINHVGIQILQHILILISPPCYGITQFVFICFPVLILLQFHRRLRNLRKPECHLVRLHGAVTEFSDLITVFCSQPRDGHFYFWIVPCASIHFDRMFCSIFCF